ncbi:MAG: ABC transporter substrate-binding protein [Propioniciclava sp.]|uniref:ABC transporter substrate-binding protein n=1 Tax=Propioniciclava sp. TaxID=2038686 RepID=UPI0039E3CB98
MKRTAILLAAGALSLSVLAGCSAKPVANTPGSGASGDTIKVGLNYELSGDVASYGQSSVAGIELAAKEINDAGGINGKKIELIKYDTKSDTAEATTLATKLMAQDKVVTVIGPATSGGMKAQIQVAAQNQVPIVSGSATADDLTVTNGKLNEYVFRTCFNDSFQGTSAANYSTEKLGAKTAVIIKDNSNDYSKGLAASFDAQFKAKGGTIVAEEAYAKGERNFNSILTKIKGQSFDVIYLPGYYEEAGPAIKQARELGITAPILGADGYDSPKLAEAAGAGLTDVYFSNHYSSADSDPRVVTFIAAFKKANNAEPNAFNAVGYDTMKFVADAVGRASAVNGPAVKEAMESTKDFAGVTGTFSVDPATHNPVKSIVFIGYKDGKIAVAEKA